MLSQFNDLILLTADDGASAPVSPSQSGRGKLADDLMEAWDRERHDRIESGLFLEEARRLLSSILAKGEVSTATRRRAKRLLLAISARNPDWET